MYFPHAYQKMFVGTGGFSRKKTLDTLALVAGEVGIIDSKTNIIADILAAAPTYAATPMVYLAQGSFRTSDKLGPFHGGYKETVKSKGINPKYVSRFFVTSPAAAQANVITIGLDAPGTVPCNKNFGLRIDVKGSVVLRTLTHNAYHEAPAYTGCCDITGTPVSTEVVYRQWAAAINEDPIINNFVFAEIEYFKKVLTAFVSQGKTEPVGWAAIVATDKYVKVVVSAAYIDTKFGDSSFVRTDHVELEPLRIYASVVDLSGNPCNTVVLGNTTEITAARQGKGYGETLLRELILDKSYRQEFFHDEKNRLNEVLGDTSQAEINRNLSYFTYNILHSVPRLGNPSGMLDNDQYLVKIVMTARDNDFETWMNKYIASANNAAALEVVL